MRNYCPRRPRLMTAGPWRRSSPCQGPIIDRTKELGLSRTVISLAAAFIIGIGSVSALSNQPQAPRGARGVGAGAGAVHAAGSPGVAVRGGPAYRGGTAY